MAGKKGMKHFGHAIIEDILRMKSEGKTNREISEMYGFKDKWVIKRIINRYNSKQRQLSKGVTPRKKGRPRKNNLQSLAEKDQLIQQLTMENELLRSFLSDVGRR